MGSPSVRGTVVTVLCFQEGGQSVSDAGPSLMVVPLEIQCYCNSGKRKEKVTLWFWIHVALVKISFQQNQFNDFCLGFLSFR